MYNIGIVGTGRIGREISRGVVEKCSNLYVWNRDEKKAEGVKFELMKDNVEDVSLDCLVEESDIIIISAGIQTKDRKDAFEENKKIMYEYGEMASKNHDKLYIIVSNPVDENCCVFYERSGIKKERIIGFSNLDRARFSFSIGYLIKNRSSKKVDVESYVVGTHDPFMVPVFSKTLIDGVKFYDKRHSWLLEDKSKLTDNLKKYGPEQVKRIGSSTRIGTAQAMGEVIDAINGERDCVCMSYLFPRDLFSGEIGFGRDVFLGWPVRFDWLDAKPLWDQSKVEEILDKEEFSQFIRSGEASVEFLEENKY